MVLLLGAVAMLLLGAVAFVVEDFGISVPSSHFLARRLRDEISSASCCSKPLDTRLLRRRS